MVYRFFIFYMLLFASNAHAATDYTISKSKCVAWSEDVVKGDYIYSFTPAIAHGGGIQVSFIALNMKGNSQEKIDTVIKLNVNGRMVRFAVQGHGPTLIFRPQDKIDTKSVLEAATTGSLAFNEMVFRTGGTKSIVNYMLAQCKE